MTWDLPWVASGSPEIPIDVARAFTYAATDGASGIIGQPFSNVLKITPTGSPSAAVMTLAGAFVVTSRFVGVTNESYVGRNDATVTTSVPATTASSRSDLVYAHITDPSQAGQPAVAAPVETRVITNVPAGTTSLNSVSGYENQTGLALARIDRPAGTSTVQASHIIDLRTSALPNIVGEIKLFGGPATAVPTDWVPCDGRALSRTVYPELFAMMGTVFGVGNGSTTFNIPDFRGRTPVGVGAGAGLTNRTLGAQGGEENHLLTVPEMPAHVHPATNSNGSNTAIVGSSAYTVQAGSDFYAIAEPAGAIEIGYSGGNVPHPIMQPWLGINYIIRAR